MLAYKNSAVEMFKIFISEKYGMWNATEVGVRIFENSIKIGCQRI